MGLCLVPEGAWERRGARERRGCNRVIMSVNITQIQCIHWLAACCREHWLVDYLFGVALRLSSSPFRGARKIADKKSPLRATSGGRAKGAGRLFVVCVNGFSSGGFRDPNSTDDDDSRRKGIRQVSKSTTHFAPVVVWANSQGEEKRVEIWTSPNLGS